MPAVFVEARPKGKDSSISDDVVEDRADQVRATYKTQEEAIGWAKKNVTRRMSRVGHLNDKKKPDQWRAI
jgi:hypothetical protein